MRTRNHNSIRLGLALAVVLTACGTQEKTPGPPESEEVRELRASLASLEYALGPRDAEVAVALQKLAWALPSDHPGGKEEERALLERAASVFSESAPDIDLESARIVFSRLAYLAREAGRSREALDHLDRGAELLPQSVRSTPLALLLSNKAEMLHEQGDVEQAVAVLRQALDRAELPRLGTAADYFRMVDLLCGYLWKIEKPQEALEERRRSVAAGRGLEGSLRRYLARALFDLGSAHYRLRDYDEALRNRLEAIEVRSILEDPRYRSKGGAAWLQIGELHLARRSLPEALAAFEKFATSVRSGESDLTGHSWYLAHCHAAQGDHQKAIRYFREALADRFLIDPDVRKILCSIGIAWSQVALGRAEEATALLEGLRDDEDILAAIHRSLPRKGSFFNMLAWSQLQAAKISDAGESLGQAAEAYAELGDTEWEERGFHAVVKALLTKDPEDLGATILAVEGGLELLRKGEGGGLGAALRVSGRVRALRATLLLEAGRTREGLRALKETKSPYHW